jgi:phosphoglycolate phosphatase
VGDGVQVLINRSFGLRPGTPEAARSHQVFMEYYAQHLTDRTVFYPGIEELIRQIPSHIRMAVLSNKPHPFTVKIIEQLGLSIYFRIVRGFSDKFPRKPSPAVLLHMMQELKARPENTLVVGDGEADMGIGQSAGCRTCAVTYGYRTRRQLAAQNPDFFIDHPKELIPILGL